MAKKRTLSCAGHILVGFLVIYLTLVLITIKELNLDYIQSQLQDYKVSNVKRNLDLVNRGTLHLVRHYARDPSNSTVNIRVPDPDVWQTVVPEKLYVYSAYLDRRDMKYDYIKIITIIDPKSRQSVYCQVWLRPDEAPVLIPGKLETFPEQYRSSHQACFIICPFEKSSLPAQMQTVSVISNSQQQRRNFLRLHDNNNNNNNNNTSNTDRRPRYNFTVCLGGPLKFGLNNTKQLTEWLELNSMFGADHFVLYNHSASGEMRPYVDYYKNRRKLIEWLPWELPDTIENPRKMKNFGHLGLVNDCLYRSMHVSAMTAFIDTDEFIVPRRGSVRTWRQLVEQTRCSAAAFISVKNVFFKKEWPDDGGAADAIKSLDLVTQLKTKRERKIWPHGSRSKYMVRPEMVKVTGIHKVWRFAASSKKESCRLAEDDALLHHYRWWDDPSPTWIEDRFMHRYQSALVGRVLRVHEQVKGHGQA